MTNRPTSVSCYFIGELFTLFSLWPSKKLQVGLPPVHDEYKSSSRLSSIQLVSQPPFRHFWSLSKLINFVRPVAFKKKGSVTDRSYSAF